MLGHVIGSGGAIVKVSDAYCDMRNFRVADGGVVHRQEHKYAGSLQSALLVLK